MKDLFVRNAGYGYAFIFLLGCLAAGAYTGFFVSLNDFWGNYLLARGASLHAPETLWNGFFPAGYTLLLKAVSSRPLVFGWILNSLFAAVLLGLSWRFYTQFLSRAWSLAGLVMLSLLPGIFQYANKAGADMGFMLFAAASFLVLLNSEDGQKNQPLWIFLSGCLAGGAALFRYHGLVWFFALLLVILLFRKRKISLIAGFSAGFILLYAVQWVINLKAGAGLFETAQAFNVYKFINGMDYHFIPYGEIQDASFQVILNDPAGFGRMYGQAFLGAMIYLLPGFFLTFMLDKDRKKQQTVLEILTLSVVYLAIVLAGGSERAALPLLPFWVFQLLIIGEAINGLRAKAFHRKLILILAILILGFPFWTGLLRDVRFLHYGKKTHSRYQTIAGQLLKEDPALDPESVFSDSFDFYFPDLLPYRPRFNGGWIRYKAPWINRQYPELCSGNSACFLADMRKEGIRYLVLDEKGLPFGAVSALLIEGRDPAFRDMGSHGGFRILGLREVNP